MNITLSVSSPILVAVLLVWLVIFLFCLANAMSREDLDPVTRLSWVVIVIFVPFFGLVLYAALRPKTQAQAQPPRDNQLYGTPWANDPGHTRSKN